jgi:hypothetical protein
MVWHTAPFFITAVVLLAFAVRGHAVPDDGFRPLPPALQQQGGASQPPLDQSLQYADALSADLYCSTVTVLSSDLGVFFGLGIAAVGFLLILFRGALRSGLFLLAGGLLFTAIPGWFESGMDSMAQILSPISGRSTVMKQKFASSQGTCDTAAGLTPKGGQANQLSGVPGIIPSTNPAQFGITAADDYYTALGKRECAGGAYTCKNRFGYLGKYQMGGKALQDAGFKDSQGNWTGKMGVRSGSNFLNNAAAQENAVRAYSQKVFSSLQNMGTTKFIGRTVNGVTITKSGLMGAAHLVGAGGVNSFLTGDGKYKTTDGNQVSAGSYLALFNGRTVQ